MVVETFVDAGDAAQAAAAIIAAEARLAVRERSRFVLALSGGRTAEPMLLALARESVPWAGVHLVQVDERIAPAGHADRNFTGLQGSLIARVAVPADHVHAMPVEAVDLDAAAERYEASLARVGGSPPVIDLVHLGLGADGHTASLVPGEAVLDVTTRDIALTGEYQGRRRMTMTLPILNRSRQILWLVAGREKAQALASLRAGDRSIPAGRVNQARARVLACVS